MKSLREQLQCLTKEDVQKHYALLHDLKAAHPNSIVLLASPHPIERYTCFVHAFDFVERPEYVEVATFGWGRYFASPDFAQWLIQYLTEISEPEAIAGDIVFYSHNGTLKHAGVFKEAGRVESKWGAGHLYEHGVFEVPESYGATVRYFKHVPFDDGIDFLRRYAEEKMRAP